MRKTKYYKKETEEKLNNPYNTFEILLYFKDIIKLLFNFFSLFFIIFYFLVKENLILFIITSSLNILFSLYDFDLLFKINSSDIRKSFFI